MSNPSPQPTVDTLEQIVERLQRLTLEANSPELHRRLRVKALAAIKAWNAASLREQNQRMLDWIHHEARVKTAHNVGYFNGQYIDVTDLEIYLEGHQQ